MKCPNCGMEVPEQARFCDGCGQWLELDSREFRRTGKGNRGYEAPAPTRHQSGNGGLTALLAVLLVLLVILLAAIVFLLLGKEEEPAAETKKSGSSVVEVISEVADVVEVVMEDGDELVSEIRDLLPGKEEPTGKTLLEGTVSLAEGGGTPDTVLISIHDTAGTLVFDKNVAPGGSFEVKLSAGEYTLKAEAEGYRTYTAAVTVAQEDDLTLSIQLQPEETSQTEPTEPKVDSVTVFHQTQDRSYYNEEGILRVEYTYDQILIADDIPSAAAINAAIARDGEAFLSELTDEKMKEYAALAWLEDDYFHNNARADVTHNSGGVLSIRVSTDRWLGGLNTHDYYGLTYDLNTGEPMTLTQLLGMEEDTLAGKLKNIAWSYLSENFLGGLLENAYDLLYDYALEDFHYYVQNGELILTFPTYSLGFGTSGAYTIPTGLYV